MNVDNIDIDHFSIDEILDLFDLKKPVTRSEINLVANEKINKFKTEKTKKLLLKAKNKLLEVLNNNNIETFFGETNNLLDVQNVVQKEIGHDNTDESIMSFMNPLKRRIQKKIIVINTKDRDLYVTLECKDTENKPEPTIPEFVNEFVAGQSRENLKRVLTEDELFAEHKISNPSVLETIRSFDLKNCLKDYNSELDNCEKIKQTPNYVDEYSLTIDKMVLH